MLIEYKEEDLKEAIDLHIDIYGQVPENFMTILNAGLKAKSEGKQPIYIFDEEQKTLRMETTEIIN